MLCWFNFSHLFLPPIRVALFILFRCTLHLLARSLLYVSLLGASFSIQFFSVEFMLMIQMITDVYARIERLKRERERAQLDEINFSLVLCVHFDAAAGDGTRKTRFYTARFFFCLHPQYNGMDCVVGRILSVYSSHMQWELFSSTQAVTLTQFCIFFLFGCSQNWSMVFVESHVRQACIHRKKRVQTLWVYLIVSRYYYWWRCWWRCCNCSSTASSQATNGTK